MKWDLTDKVYAATTILLLATLVIDMAIIARELVKHL